MKLVANKQFYYDRRMVKAEEEFECDEKFVHVLVTAQAARKAEEQVTRKTRAYKRRDMVAESP